MTLYFDYRVNVGEVNSVYTYLDWHRQHALLAVASYNSDRGGAVYICDELGEKLPDVYPGTHPVSQVTFMLWHPGRKMLVVMWLNGEMRVWNDSDMEYTLVPSTRQSPIIMAKWSLQGTRLITIDTSGEIGGWRLDARGQLMSLFWVRIDTGRPVCLEIRKTTPATSDLAPKTPKSVAEDQIRDIFTSWRPRTAGRRTTMLTDNVAYYLASDTGSVYLLSEGGAIKEVLKAVGKVQTLMYHEKEDYLLVVSEGFNMGYYSVDSDGTLQEITKVKVSGSEPKGPVCWAGVNLVASAVGDLTVRFWQPSTGDSFSIRMYESEDSLKAKSTISSLIYSHHKGLLVGCTNTGSVMFWRKSYDGSWSQVACSRLKQVIKQASWGPNLLAIITNSSAYVLREHNLSACYSDQVSIIQVSSSLMVLHSGDESSDLNTDLQVSGITLCQDKAAVWSGKTVAVYQVLPITAVNVIGSFSYECGTAGIWEQSLAVLTLHGKVEILSLEGSVKQTINTDSQAITLSLTGPYLTVSNINGMLQVWDVSKREVKPVSKMKDLVDSIDDFGEVMLAVANCNATKVALTVADSSLSPVPCLFVWNIDVDTMLVYAFTSEVDNDVRFIMDLRWDLIEPRFLVATAKRPTPLSKTKRRLSNYSPLWDASNTILASFIVTSSHGLLFHEALPMDENFISFLQFDTPYFIILEKPSHKTRVAIRKIVMKEFEGLEECDEQTKNAVINFSISLLVNDVDQAFKSIRSVKSVGVWTALARMCVKGRRLDVAKICLGHMQMTRAIAALNDVEEEPEEEAKLATLALHLGMNEEAERLYKQCKRFDLLNKLYQRSGKWDKALELSQNIDRIHLRNTYHNYARHLEREGNVEKAMQMYFKAETHRHEVPRMLLGDNTALEKYISNSKDPILMKWWAQYMESTGNMDSAMQYYKDASDHLAIVRVMCYLEDFDNASVIADTSGDKAACYHLARALENVGKYQEAIHFFTRGTAYANAIRLCKEQGMDDQLWALALSAGVREQVDAAKYLEVSSPERSVLLYHRAGLLHRAVDLAFVNNLYDAIEIIATELTADSDKDLLIKCAEFFIEQEHFEKAVHLLAIAKEFEDAIQLCWKRNVPLNDELGEVLTPGVDHPDKGRLVEILGDCALSQANYHLATKKYTQSGNKLKAMKALLKSGDTEKIIFFANVSRQKEMYIMAGNYLQTLDWQAKPELLKTIVSFYTKGKAPHLLSNFYQACAQVEVDDYGNYEKALGALNEALRCLGKNTEQHSHIVEAVTRKIALVNKFIDIKRLLERGDSETGLAACQQLLSVAGELVRRGDVYALMVEEAAKRGDWNRAKQLALQLQHAQPSDNLAFYLHQDLLSRLGLNEPLPKQDSLIDDEDNIIEDETIGTSF